MVGLANHFEVDHSPLVAGMHCTSLQETQHQSEEGHLERVEAAGIHPVRMAVVGGIAGGHMVVEVADTGRRAAVRSLVEVERMAVGKLREAVYRTLVGMSQKAHLGELHTLLAEHRTTLFATRTSTQAPSTK